MLPKEITDVTEFDEEDDYDFYFSKADFNSDELTLDLNLTVRDVDEPDSFRKWKVIAKGTLNHLLLFEKTAVIQLADNHPLLWEFIDNHCSLYFVGQIKSPEKVFYDLLFIHFTLFKNYQPFPIYFGDSKDFSNRFQYTTGLLTSGPKTLMLEYGKSLRKNGLDFNLINETNAKVWNGEKWISLDYKPKVLLLGDSYVIAKEFLFVQQLENSR